MESTKRALIMSVASMILCVAMLFSTSFAWFADSVRSGTNNIQSGNLDVEMYYAEGKEAPASATWRNARHELVFDYDRWEPGYTDVKHIKIANEGVLSFKYSMEFCADDAENDALKLAEKIDVYAFNSATQIINRSALDNAHWKGTLKDFLTNLELGITGNLMSSGSKDADGHATDEKTFTIALKMQDVVDSEFQGLSVGDGFSVVVKATQYAFESDSFGNDYDKDATYPTNIVIPKAYHASNQEGVNSAASSAKDGDLILLPETNESNKLTIPANVAGKKITIKGVGIDKTYVNHNTVQEMSGADLTIKNLTLVGAGGSTDAGFKDAAAETYVGCRFTGKSFFYAPTAFCENCKFDQSEYEYCFWIYGAKEITFENCTFNTKGMAVNVCHGDCTNDTHNVTFNNCNFAINEPADGGTNKPAIVVDGRGSVFNINIKNCKSTGYKCNDPAMNDWYSTYMSSASDVDKQLIGCEGSGISKIHVTIDGKKYN